MEHIYTYENNSRKAIISKLDNGKFEVVCLIGEQLSHGFPPKEYKTIGIAHRYAHKFTTFNS